MTGRKRIISAAAAVILSLTLVCSAPLSAEALTINPIEQIIAALLGNKEDDSINVSSVSAEKILLGDTLMLYGDAAKADPAKCEYAYYVRHKGLMWTTLKTYGKDRSCEWTPDEMGDYEICIKVKYGKTIGKKYFDIRVTSELFNESYISTTFVQQGGSLELTARSHGGFGNTSYAFLYRRQQDIDWTALSGFSTAEFIKWKPIQAGDYDICIKAKDDDGQIKEKYFELTVSEPQLKTPTEFTLTVRSPVSSPYFWECETEDRNILEYYVTEKPAEIEKLRTYVVLEYHFRTVSAGVTSIRLSYDSHNGKQYQLDYNVTVDKNLNYTVSEGIGEYSEPVIPEPEQIKKKFSISVPQAEAGTRWKYEVSDSLVADIVPSSHDEDEYVTYNFEAVRQGCVTVTLSCVSVTGRKEIYKLIYDIYVGEGLEISVRNADGFYAEGEPLPYVDTDY